jgi:hypothetical protein
MAWIARLYKFIIKKVQKTEINGRGDSLRWPRDTHYPLKLALTSLTSGGRSVGIVRWRTKPRSYIFKNPWSMAPVQRLATGWKAGKSEFGPRHGKRFSFPPQRPDRLCGPPNVLHNGYMGIFPGDKAAREWRWLFTSIQCRRYVSVELYDHSHIRLHGVVFN